MRFRTVVLHASWISVTVWLVKSLVLSAQGRLGVYIHPRFFTFTAVLCAIGLVLAIVSKLTHKPHADTHEHVHQKSTFALVTLLAASATAIMPSISLSAASVVNRGSSTYAAHSIKLSARYDQFTIKDWAGLIMQTEDTAQYVSKPVALEGFISRTESLESPALVSRFGVTCCAIDAEPMSLPLRSSEGINNPKNQWIRIKGIWQKDATAPQGISIKVTELAEIPQPKEPYVY